MPIRCQEGTRVYKFYFDHDSGELKFRHLPVLTYQYMDGMQWNVIDMYTLIEEKKVRKYLVFKEIQQIKHPAPGVLIDQDFQVAKVKFLYHFVTHYDTHAIFSYLSDIEKKCYSDAKNQYNTFVKDFPEILLKIEDLIGDGVMNYNHFWK